MINSVCIFGDSLSKGVVFDEVGERYMFTKACFANQIQASSNIEVTNYSKFGSTITKGLMTMAKHKTELSHFDYVVLEFGGNDCDFDWKDISINPQQKHKPKTPIPLFIKKYTEMISEVIRNGGNPVVFTLPPIDSKRYFSWISRGLNGKNILKWLGDVSTIYNWHEKYNQAVYQIAQKTKIPLIDITSEFMKRTDFNLLLCKDGIHINEKGHELIRSLLDRKISSLNPTFSFI